MKMFGKILVPLAAAGLLMGSVAVQAQFTANQQAPVTTVKMIKDSGKDDQLVTIEGKLIKQVKKDDYIFQDATGQIIVDIDAKVFAGQKVTPDTVVRLDGEIDKDIMKEPEVDVHKLTIVK